MELIQGWFPLGLTGLISLQSKGFSKASPPPQYESMSSLVLSLPYGSTETFIHDYWKDDMCRSHLRLFATPWTIASQAPLSMEFSRQEYWSGLLFPTPGDLPNPRIEPMLLASPTLAGRDSLPLGSPYDHLQPQTNPLSPSSIYLLPLSSFCQNK